MFSYWSQSVQRFQEATPWYTLERNITHLSSSENKIFIDHQSDCYLSLSQSKAIGSSMWH